MREPKVSFRLCELLQEMYDSGLTMKRIQQEIGGAGIHLSVKSIHWHLSAQCSHTGPGRPRSNTVAALA